MKHKVSTIITVEVDDTDFDWIFDFSGSNTVTGEELQSLDLDDENELDAFLLEKMAQFGSVTFEFVKENTL